MQSNAEILILNSVQDCNSDHALKMKNMFVNVSQNQASFSMNDRIKIGEV